MLLSNDYSLIKRIHGAFGKKFINSSDFEGSSPSKFYRESEFYAQKPCSRYFFHRKKLELTVFSFLKYLNATQIRGVPKVCPFILLLVLVSCQSGPKKEGTNSKQKPIETITLLGDTLFTPAIRPGKAKEKFESAKLNFQEFPDSVEALIWYGRRTAYLGKFQDAIEIYSIGLEKFPEEPRLYRHRGHRYISTRQYDKAISDFEKAATLVEDLPDQVEPDGIPNPRNIPISTLKGNIWYHLGLAYYLKGDMENAQKIFSKREVTNKYDDNLVSGGHWLFMILKRMGKDAEAQKQIANVTPDMDIIENTRYHQMCLFYKGIISKDDLKMVGDGSSSDDVYFYGLGNWNLYESKDTLEAKRLYKRLLDNGNPYSFAYLAAEADWQRIFSN